MTQPRRHNVAVLGLGYVGLPLAVAAAQAGHRVWGYDVNFERVHDLDSGVPGVEDVTELDLKHVLASSHLRVTTDPAELASCDTYVICVPTPLRDRIPDLSMVLEAVETVASVVSPGNLVILESTTYPGTTEEIVAPRIEALSGLSTPDDYYLVFSPERIDPGNSSFQLKNTPKVVGGIGGGATELAMSFYGSFIHDVRPVSRPRQAEMAKLLENTFRHVNIALVNEMAAFCAELDIDLWEVIEAAASKPFGFMPFRPGPGVGGHCIPIDPAYLSWRVRRLGYPFRFVELACEINEGMPDYVALRAADVLNTVGKPLKGSTILMLGVAYKPDVADVRESPAHALARKLGTRGAKLAWHDPYVQRFDVDGATLERVDDLAPDDLRAADLVLIHTDHSCYDWDAVVDHAQLVFDTRNATRARCQPHVVRL